MTEPKKPTGRPPAMASWRVPRLPGHVAVLLGLSASTYAAFLAGASALEAANETAAVADRAPIADTLARLVAGHDRLSAQLDDARERYGEASDAYSALVVSISSYEARLADLAARIDAVQREAASLPGTVATPRPVAAGAGTTGTTGSATGLRQVTTISQPVATPKPATTTVTGASGTKP